MDAANEFPGPLCQRTEFAVVQQLAEPDDAVQRRSQLVRHICQKLALHAARGFDPAVSLLQVQILDEELFLHLLAVRGFAHNIRLSRSVISQPFRRNPHAPRKARVHRLARARIDGSRFCPVEREDRDSPASSSTWRLSSTHTGIRSPAQFHGAIKGGPIKSTRTRIGADGDLYAPGRGKDISRLIPRSYRDP